MPYHRIISVFFILALALLPDRSAAASAESPSAQFRGQPTCIVVPNSPTPAEEQAFNDLSTYIAQLTGRKLPHVGESRPRPEGRALVVGKTQSNVASLHPETWAPDTIYIGYGDPDIAIVGEGDQGTLFAVCEFLRDQGCRWYWPGGGGEFIPRIDTLTLKAESHRYTPSFDRRGWSPMRGPQEYWKPGQYYYPWAVRNMLNGFCPATAVAYPPRYGYGTYDRMGHTIPGLIPSGDYQKGEVFAEHPGWYPKIDGKRVWQRENGGTVQACFSNPEVTREIARRIIEWFDINTRCELFVIGNGDSNDHCECEDCLVMDGPHSTWKKNDRFDASGARSKSGPSPMSTRMMELGNRVARIVAKKYPGKYVGIMAYGSTVAPPRGDDWKLEPNMMVSFTTCDGVCYTHDPQDPTCRVNRLNDEWIRGWSKDGNPVILYTYPPGSTRFQDVPVGHTHVTKRFVEYAKGVKVLGWSGEGDASWMGSGVWQSLKARLLWDIDTDVDAFVEEYCRYVYGPAALTMKAFYDLIDHAIQHDLDHSIYGSWVGALPPDALTELDERIRQAEREAVDGEPRDVRNVAAMRVAMNSLLALALELNASNAEYAALFQRYDGIRDDTLGLVKQYDIPLTGPMRNRFSRGYRPPFEALSGQKVASLPMIWRFRTDPGEKGLAEDWNDSPNSDGAEWHDIRVDESWTTQGYNYHGTAWYAVTLHVPPDVDGPLWLLFDGMDGDAKIWVDGQSVGELPLHPWDGPKSLDISKFTEPAHEHQLVVRVNKMMFAAGIFKPVHLVVVPGA